jgi:UDP-GlcNAc:undecaprenyl-phosphate/decaprenyl-phosphate GlcNAc-1-phosphate transferase
MDFDFHLLLFVLAPVFAFACVFFLIPKVQYWALAHGFVDAPDAPGGRKTHKEAVPPLGGLALFSVFLPMSLMMETGFENSAAYYVAVILILIVGVIDDKKELPANFKFAIHFLTASILVVFGQAQILSLGNLLGFGPLDLGWFSIPFSIMCVVYIINAINMMDGMDGLAGGQSCLIFLWLMVGAAVSGWWEPFFALSLLVACLLGFLVFNFRHPKRERASIFLGDAGSMALGLTIAWFAIHMSQSETAPFPAISVAWILALPIIDAFGLLVARLKEGLHPFHPDRRHFHHHFLHAEFSVRRATYAILAWGGFLGAVGVLGYWAGLPEMVLGWAWIILWLSHAYMTTKPQKFIVFLSGLKKIKGS